MKKTSLRSAVSLLTLFVLIVGILPASAQPSGIAVPSSAPPPAPSVEPERAGTNTLWNIETVDSTNAVGWDSSIALDAAGRPHISYCREEPYMGGVACAALKYTWSDGTTWHTETVDTEWFTGKDTSLALDSAGRPHIAYTRQYCEMGCGPVALKYAFYNGATWQIQVVDPGNAGAYPSLALDSLGRPHLTYGVGNGGLKYAWYDGSTWQIEVVEYGALNGYFSSLVLDVAGRPHIVYVNTDTYQLKYAWYDGTSWQIEVIDSYSSVVGGSTLVLDQFDQPHVAYCDPNNLHLKYAWRDEAGWQSEIVDMQRGELHRSFALDSLDRPRIAYYDITSGRDDLRYAWHDGASWHIETVDSAGDVGQFASLTLDALDQVHISYSDDTNGDLKYAMAPCVPAQALDIGGPTRWSTGVTASYTVSYAPTNTTFPQLVWDNNTVGPSSFYSWTVPGLYSVTVTATNPCSEISGTRRVAVVCQPPEQVTAVGPATLFANQGGTYQAAVQPITASLPITYTWDNGLSGPTSAYTWTVPGIYTRMLTATNECGHQVGSFSVTVSCLPVERSDFSWSPLTPTMGQPVTFTAAILPIAKRWLTETVDDHIDVATGSSLVIDAADRPHVSYVDYTSHQIDYAYRQGLAWRIEPAADLDGTYPSLVLDNNGYPHLSSMSIWGDLMYALYDGSHWLTETVDGEGPTGESSLKLDSLGRPHISYYGYPTCLKYAWYDGTAWQIETVDDFGDIGRYSSLALDAQGYPHISYSEGPSDGALRYAWYDGSTWHIQELDPPGITHWFTSLVLDAAGRPHIGYACTGPDPYVGYASYDGTAWQFEIVDDIGVSLNTSLVLDSAGRPHLSYFEFTSRSVKYAYREGTLWHVQAVDSGLGQWGGYNSLALDSHDGPQISYYAPANGQFRYAWLEYVPPTAPISYTWDLGDGTMAQGPAVQHAYLLPGDYAVALTATNCQGEGIAVATHTVTVSGALPCDPVQEADFSWTPLTPTAGLPMTLTASASGTLPITFTWDMGDGTVSTGVSLTHIYTLPGDYTVTLTAANCATSTATSIHHFAVTTPPVLCEAVHEPLFIWTPLTPTTGQPVSLTASASGTLPISFTWDLGDGTAGTGLSLTHAYTTPGVYTVTLTAANCATATVSAVHTLTITMPPTTCVPVHGLLFTWTPLTPTVGEVVTFTAGASGTMPITFSWELGDGTSGQGQVLTHSFALPDRYMVTLVATNDCGEGRVSLLLEIAAREWRVYLALVL